ncbi:MAG: LysR family transcriptional regulator [Deltaproteobacteria bacterium]|nr:LysR family transcriptional regulator [Deltaproteobacteria bacterium]
MLNFHHLHYFWMVAKEGSVVAAAAALGVAQPTISSQLKELEAKLGEPLFERRGRRLILTEMGRVTLRYADEIFALGTELEETLRGRAAPGPARFTVGVSDSLPKLTTWLMLEPTVRSKDPVRLVLRVGKSSELLTELSLHNVDVVLADQPQPTGSKVKAWSHMLGESDVTIFGRSTLVDARRRGFPKSLDEAPFVLQTENTALRRSLDAFFSASGIRPRIVAEAEDMGMLQVLGQEGLGLFAAPSVASEAIQRQHGVIALGRLSRVVERFYAITVERKLKHPAAVALSNAARSSLFG